MAYGCAARRYRARNPRATPVYRLFETHFDEVKGQWEERFERRCGFWRGFVDEQVRRYLDCGLLRTASPVMPQWELRTDFLRRNLRHPEIASRSQAAKEAG